MGASEQIPVLAVVGPTASGKTSLAVRLAKYFDAEIISADSMQIYSELFISTARPSAEEMDGVPHHLVGFLPPDCAFSAADFCTRAAECVREIRSRGKNVILCGGTGLYVQSFLDNISFTGEGADSSFRAQMQAVAQVLGNRAVWRLLDAVDPDGAASLHPNNLGRVIRALEVFRTTGCTLAQQRSLSRSNPSPYRALVLCLDFRDRQNLYARIDRRVDAMVRCGLEQEARAFYEKYGFDDGTARQAIGCKAFAPYFRGEISFDAAVSHLKQQTRRYAKRQLTWFRRMPDIQRIYMDDTSDPFRQAVDLIGRSGLFTREEGR